MISFDRFKEIVEFYDPEDQDPLELWEGRGVNRWLVVFWDRAESPFAFGWVDGDDDLTFVAEELLSDPDGCGFHRIVDTQTGMLADWSVSVRITEEPPKLFEVADDYALWKDTPKTRLEWLQRQQEEKT